MRKKQIKKNQKEWWKSQWRIFNYIRKNFNQKFKKTKLIIAWIQTNSLWMKKKKLEKGMKIK